MKKLLHLHFLSGVKFPNCEIIFEAGEKLAKRNLLRFKRRWLVRAFVNSTTSSLQSSSCNLSKIFIRNFGDLKHGEVASVVMVGVVNNIL